MKPKKLKKQNDETPTQSHSIGSLPPEILVTIFEFLNLNSLLNCRLVSKEWKQNANSVKITNLSVQTFTSKSVQRSFRRVFSFSNEPIDFVCTLFTCRSINFLKIKFMRPILMKIRKLFISSFNSKTFESALSQLTELEQLQIDELDFRGKMSINLPNLTCLSVKIIFLKPASKLIVNAPNLSKLQWAYTSLMWPTKFDRLELSNPSKITHLATWYYHHSDHQIRECIRFKNCQYLYLDDLQEAEFYSAITIFELKEMHINSFVEASEVSRMFKKLKSSNRSLKLYLSDFLISDPGELDDVNLCRPGTQSVINNYKKLSNFVTSVRELNYSLLINYFSDSLPVDFHAKFVTLRKVIADQVVRDQNSFVQFVRNSRMLEMLSLANTSLDQSFYDALHRNCPYIFDLKINESTSDLNSSFVLNLKYLKLYEINQQVSSELIRSLMKNTPTFRSIAFMLDGEITKVYRGACNRLRIKQGKSDKYLGKRTF